MNRFWSALTLPAALAISAVMTPVSLGTASAETCTAPAAADELTPEQVDTLYSCIRDELRAGYAKNEAAIATDYTGWPAASSRPAAPGVHGSRFLMTFVNDVGHAEYVKYAEEGVEMPVGTLIAKESFKLNKKLEARRGPLFTMEKVAAGTADETDNWVYGGVLPNGKNMKFKQSFCHDCHVAFEDQDNLGYPAEEARISN